MPFTRSHLAPDLSAESAELRAASPAFSRNLVTSFGYLASSRLLCPSGSTLARGLRARKET